MIVLGLDPGSLRSGYSIIHATGGHGRPIAASFLRGGEIESEPEAWRETVRSTIHTAHIYSSSLCVAVEWVEGIAFPAKGAGIVPHLVSSAAVAGGVAWMALAMGVGVRKISARDWRRTLFAKPQSSDQEIKAKLPGLFQSGWPKRSNVHVRDAAGCALACAWRELSMRRVA